MVGLGTDLWFVVRATRRRGEPSLRRESRAANDELMATDMFVAVQFMLSAKAAGWLAVVFGLLRTSMSMSTGTRSDVIPPPVRVTTDQSKVPKVICMICSHIVHRIAIHPAWLIQAHRAPRRTNRTNRNQPCCPIWLGSSP